MGIQSYPSIPTIHSMSILHVLPLLFLLLPASGAPGGSSMGGVYKMRRAGADSEFAFTFDDDSSSGFDIGSLPSIPQYGDYHGGAVEHDRVVGFTGDYGGEVGNIEYLGGDYGGFTGDYGNFY